MLSFPSPGSLKSCHHQSEGEVSNQVIHRIYINHCTPLTMMIVISYDSSLSRFVHVKFEWVIFSMVVVVLAFARNYRGLVV